MKNNQQVVTAYNLGPHSHGHIDCPACMQATLLLTQCGEDAQLSAEQAVSRYVGMRLDRMMELSARITRLRKRRAQGAAYRDETSQ